MSDGAIAYPIYRAFYIFVTTIPMLMVTDNYYIQYEQRDDEQV